MYIVFVKEVLEDGSISDKAIHVNTVHFKTEDDVKEYIQNYYFNSGYDFVDDSQTIWSAIEFEIYTTTESPETKFLMEWKSNNAQRFFEQGVARYKKERDDDNSVAEADIRSSISTLEQYGYTIIEPKKK